MTELQLMSRLAGKLGSYSALAVELGVTRQTIWNWRQNGIFKPFKRSVADLASEHEIAIPSNFLPKRKSNGKAKIRK